MRNVTYPWFSDTLPRCILETRLHCFPHLYFFPSSLLFHCELSVHAASLLLFLPSSTAFGLIPSPPPQASAAAPPPPPPPDPLRPVLFTFPAVGNHAGAWLADKPSCWLMGRPLRVQLWEGRWTLVKRKRWQSHPPPTHTHTQPRLHLEGRH